MSLKRRAEDDYSLPSKRALVRPLATYADAASHGPHQAASKLPAVADLASAGPNEEHQQQSQQQQKTPLSTCTDLIPYKPPSVLDAAVVSQSLSSMPSLVLGNGHVVDMQQPNAMSLVLRSLTPEQRASLKGIWDVLRDQITLSYMLRKLPGQPQHDTDANAAAAAAAGMDVASGSTVSKQPGTDAQCIIEEIGGSDSDDSKMAAAAPPQQQQVVSATAALDKGFVPSGISSSNISPLAAAPGSAVTAAEACGLGPFYPAGKQALPSSTAACALGQQQSLQYGYSLQQQQQQQQQQQHHFSGPADVMMIDDALRQQHQLQRCCKQDVDADTPVEMDVDF